jgi:y4mF family transcriptional regulator
MTNISSFIKYNRKRLKITQEELANKAGVGIRFIRELEQGKETLRLDKANQVLSLFGFCLAPSKQEIDPYKVALDFNNNNSKYFSKPLKIILKNKIEKFGFIIQEIIDPEENKINAWKFVSNSNAIKYQQKPDDNFTEIILHSDIQEIEGQ